MEPIVKTNKPKIAGILSIVAGAIWIVSMVFGVWFLWELVGLFTAGSTETPSGVMLLIVVLIAIPMTAFGVVAILGGIAAMHYHKWGLALAGSICSFFCMFCLGIPSIILIISARNEFSKNTPS